MTTDDAFRDTETVATGAGGGALTVTLAVALRPSHVAVITPEPTPAAVTMPVEETVAAAAFELAHVTTRPLSAAPDASRAVAVSCAVWPIVRFADVGVRLSDDTGTRVTVTTRFPV